jgi:hypothetical protein
MIPRQPIGHRQPACPAEAGDRSDVPTVTPRHGITIVHSRVLAMGCRR